MVAGRSIIVGAGGFGRELVGWAQDCHAAGTLPPVAGLIDDDPQVMNGFGCQVGLLGTVADFQPQPGDLLLMAIGTPATKTRVAETLLGRGARFGTLRHPSAVVANSARVDEGSIICPLALVSADATLERFCTVNVLSSVGHGVRVGEFSTLSAHIDLTGAVQIGRVVMIGTGAKVLPRVKVGEGATVGAGAVVYRNVPAGGSVFSAPAKLLKPR